MKKRLVYYFLALCISALGVYGAYQYYLLYTAYGTTLDTAANLQYQFDELSDKLKAADALNNDLQVVLQGRVKDYETAGAQVQVLSSTVSTLDKLTKTDKELLEKYSSVYFLNENYVPQHLTNIDAAYLSRPDRPEQLIAGVLPHLTDLLKAASAEHVPLQILSAYRSFGTQANLKSTYKVAYGAGTANSFSADQGYSEHQLGTTVDFTTPTLGATLSGFDKTSAYPWLSSHAYLYGYILSYPKGNTHFVFEPWHWRYVGLELAKRLHNEGKNFYDLDQRDINTYLIKFFD